MPAGNPRANQQPRPPHPRTLSLAYRPTATSTTATQRPALALFLLACSMARQSVSTPGIDPLRVQVGTFNCNLQGSSSASPDLTHWLVPTISEKSSEYNANPDTDGRPAPDIYAVGFQELLPLPDGFANNEKAHEAITKTDRAIRRAIRPQAALTRSDGKYPHDGGPEDYTLIATSKMVGIVLFVYARERAPTASGRAGTGVSALPSVVERIKEVRTATVGTGLLGLMGNKGAAGVRVVVGGAVPGQPDESLTFVCAHLAAHDHNVPRRNADWKSIVARLVFSPASVQPLPAPPIQATSGQGGSGEKAVDGITERYQTAQGSRESKRTAKALDDKSHGVYETSHLFVFGDLNYRIGFNVTPSASLARKGYEGEMLKKSDVKRKINQADWRTLATYDQLSIEHTHPDGPRVFHGLVEPHLPTIGYGPTYKFKVDKEARKRAERAAEKGAVEPVQAGAKASTAFGELSGKRVPGWTDRILWASTGASEGEKSMHGVTPELFRSIMRYTVSVMMPPLARFLAPLTPAPFPTALGPQARHCDSPSAPAHGCHAALYDAPSGHGLFLACKAGHWRCLGPAAGHRLVRARRCWRRQHHHRSLRARCPCRPGCLVAGSGWGRAGRPWLLAWVCPWQAVRCLFWNCNQCQMMEGLSGEGEVQRRALVHDKRELLLITCLFLAQAWEGSGRRQPGSGRDEDDAALSFVDMPPGGLPRKAHLLPSHSPRPHTANPLVGGMPAAAPTHAPPPASEARRGCTVLETRPASFVRMKKFLRLPYPAWLD